MAVYELPSSFAQRRMWLLAQMDPDQPTYNIAWALRLDGELDVGALRRAWDAAVLRHEALRTTFRDASGIPVQVVADGADAASLPALTFVDVEGVSEAEREDAGRVLIRDLARVPMDLAAGPLVHVRLVQVGERSHLLGVVMHHIVTDGWSFRILFDELSADYEAIVRGSGAAVEEPPIQYADFAIWQIEHAEDGGHVAAERFWRSELAEVPSALALPVDRGYAARQTFSSASLGWTIDAELAGALGEAAAKRGTTLFALLLTAYATVLGRLSGADDLVIVVPVAARSRAETEAVVGLFMNTVPVRVRPARGMTLSAFADSVHGAVARVLAHEDLPYARIVELARPERSPARSPLAQVMFAMEEAWTVPDRGGLRWRPELVDNGTCKFELEVTVTGTEARVDYNTDLFDRQTAQLVAEGFQRVLRALVEAPERRVGEVEIMDAETLALVTRVWPSAGSAGASVHAGSVPPRAAIGASARSSAAGEVLPRAAIGASAQSSAAGEVPPRAAVEASAQSRAAGDAALQQPRSAVAQLWAATVGDTVVAQGGDGTLTGSQLRDRALRVAGALRDRGVGAGDQVAVMVPRGVRVLPALLGIWLVGATYVPLDPTHPAQRLTTMLADADVGAILVEGLTPPPISATVIDLTALGDSGDTAASIAVPDLPPTAVAYTLFTSGSTGRPKAVEVSQGNLGAFLDAVRPLLAMGPGDVLVCVSTFAFDISLLDLLVPVLVGARVVIAEADHMVDAAALRALLTDSGATVLQCTPATWRMLVDAGGVPPGVTLRVSGGDALPRDLADAIGEGRGVRLWNNYGPTETTIYCGGALVGPSPEPIQVAPSFAGSELYILDDELRPVPPGVVGEVCVGGAEVANGYRGAPGVTASRFVPDPFSGRPGARLYRTGDLARWRRNGRMEMLGRVDRQLKIRGHRVESGEVEAALRTHPDVAEAVVALRGQGDDVRLVAYVASRSSSDDLLDHVRGLLPDYMVPAAVVALPELPLTPAGKIDHRSLPEPQWRDLSTAAVAPRTPVEAELAKVFAELLGLPEPPGVTDNFFVLGGHSLTATRLMAEVRGRFGVELPLRVLFAAPCVAGLAAALADAGTGGGR